VTVVDGKATEWRFIIDSQVIESLVVSLTTEADE
jgi:hypothetical protein